MRVEKKYGQWSAGTPSCTQSKPSTGRNEFAFKINFSIPDAYFERPELSISISMPDVENKAKLTSEISENIGQIIKEQLGLNAHLTISADEEQPDDQ